MDLAYTRFDIRVSTISNLHVFMELIFNPGILETFYYFLIMANINVII